MHQNKIPTAAVNARVPTTAETIDMKVMVETLQPSGWERSSHLSREPRGQMSGFRMGSRRGNEEWFGMQVADCKMR